MNKIILLTILPIFCLFFCINSNVLMADEFYQRKAEGWHWYEDRKQLSKEQAQEQKEEVEQTASIKTVVQLRQEAEEKLSTAIANPTIENVKAYMLVQKQIIDQSNLFSEIWKRVVYTNPDLDATIKNPSAQYGIHLENDLKNEKKKKSLEKLSKEYGLFYFYKNDCPYCKKFLPLVQNFAQKYNFSLLPVSMDGYISADLPNSRIDNGISETLGIKQVPALIAVHSATAKTIPLSYGLISLDEIEERAFFLTKDHEVANE